MSTFVNAVRQMRADAKSHLGTEVIVSDAIGNEIATITAVVSKTQVTEQFSNALVNQHRIRFDLADLPNHAAGLSVKTWRGDFTLFAVVDKTDTTVTYSLQ